ncbi:hypothetical protein AKJ53_01495 [candidate division MSBL1 archaeon SCGC-AAA382F02]|uniref:Uncharacterized protein n=1 Tax=candidate division MSBL1 archaeon SCGC-AAA382F02 TaxID=1698282 RepID=A0A133VHW2_9EURY|nr:hypothetical protein AKJ53_01495 [candidate division MSBL1 archaeon SCGC-AAA382F02]
MSNEIKKLHRQLEERFGLPKGGIEKSPDTEELTKFLCRLAETRDKEKEKEQKETASFPNQAPETRGNGGENEWSGSRTTTQFTFGTW